MSAKLELQAKKREIKGRKVKDLRREGIIPAVIYGHNFESQSIEVDLKEFSAVYTEAGESTLVYINIGKDKHPTIIVDVQTNSISDEFEHIDFHKVSLEEKVVASIPLVFIGESFAVKQLGGILVKNMQNVEVEGFPQDLPHELQVDISSLLKLEDSILISDLKIDNKLTVKGNAKDIMILVQAPMSDDELADSLENKVGDIEAVEVVEKKKIEVPVEPEEPETK